MTALVAASILIGCGDEGPPAYERREGPRLSRAERGGILEYTHSLSANLCYRDDGITRNADREFRAFERLLRTKPEALIKTKVAYSDYGDIPRDMTLRKYAEETRDLLRENFERLPPEGRQCQLRYAQRLNRSLR